MQMITAVDHIGIRVAELATARHFYQQLGFIFIEGPVGPEPVAIMRHPSGVVINLILNADCSPTENILMDVPQKHAGYTHFAFTVTDLGEVQRHLASCNIVITEGPTDFGPGHGASIFIRDQDRNVIEFHQS